MTTALTEAPAMIDEDDASRADLNESLGDRYIYLRFKQGDGQPPTYVRVKAASRNTMSR